MEGVFSFFLESTFLGLLLHGEKRLGDKVHWFAAFMVFLGSWLSGYFIIVTDAWMQHPVGYHARTEGRDPAQQFLGTALQSMGGLAVFAQHDRCRDHGLIRDGGRWSVLPAQWQA